MAAIYIKCCGKFHEVIQFTTKGPIQYGAECSKCGRRVAAETPEDVGWKWWKWEQMNPKLLDAGLAERLEKIWDSLSWAKNSKVTCENRWESVAAEVRKIVKEATKGGRK